MDNLNAEAVQASIEPKSDQLNADDVQSATKTITVTKVVGGSSEQPIFIYYKGENKKSYRPCKSMIRTIVHCWTDEAKNWIGKSMTLFCDPAVKFGGVAVGGIRISHMSHIKGKTTIPLTMARGRKSPYSVEVLKVEGTEELEKLKARCLKEAKGGTESLKNFFMGLSAPDRKKIEAYKEECKVIASKVVVEQSEDVPDEANEKPEVELNIVVKHPTDGEISLDNIEEVGEFLLNCVLEFKEIDDADSVEIMREENKTLLEAVKENNEKIYNSIMED